MGRAFLALLGFYTVAVLAGGVLGLVVPQQIGSSPLGFVASQAVVQAGAAGVASAVWAAAGWASWRDQGWTAPKPGARAFALGLAIGTGMAVVVIAVELAVGVASISITQDKLTAYLVAGTAVAALLTIAALAEELVFRGFPLSRLAAAVGPVKASLALAVGFSAIHGINPGVTALGLINVGLASLMLSAAFLGWGGLPAAWGTHLGWNAGIAIVADAPVSGIRFDVPVVEFQSSGPEWLSGGAFGPEGGLVASVVMIAATVLLGRRVFVPLSPQGRGDRGEAGVRA